MTTGDAREAILERIRSALGPGPRTVSVAREYRTSLPAGIDLVERFTDRLVDYRAIVHRATEEELPATIAAALRARAAAQVVMPTGVPDAWMADAQIEVVRDAPPLSHADLDALDAVVTGCTVAIAETGTIVLDGGPGQGRRALSLLPDHHVCVVRVDQIVGDVPEALPRLDPRRPMTWISGPSATSDIELQRVEGVHGPRHLEVVIVEG